MEKTFPLNSEELKKLTQTYPTPFYLYDEKAIRENMRKFTKAFSIFPKFREHLFACKSVFCFFWLSDYRISAFL